MLNACYEDFTYHTGIAWAYYSDLIFVIKRVSVSGSGITPIQFELGARKSNIHLFIIIMNGFCMIGLT